MNRLPTVKIRHRVTGKTRIVNSTIYAANLGAWGDWRIVETRDGGGIEANVVSFEKRQEEIEATRRQNPKSPSYHDAQKAYEARALTTATNVTAPPVVEETAKEVTSVTNAPAPPEAVEREVPVIGGSQVVKMRGRPPKRSDDEVL